MINQELLRKNIVILDENNKIDIDNREVSRIEAENEANKYKNSDDINYFYDIIFNAIYLQEVEGKSGCPYHLHEKIFL